jgi:hypothetical protein
LPYEYNIPYTTQYHIIFIVSFSSLNNTKSSSSWNSGRVKMEKWGVYSKERTTPNSEKDAPLAALAGAPAWTSLPGLGAGSGISPKPHIITL